MNKHEAKTCHDKPWTEMTVHQCQWGFCNEPEGTWKLNTGVRWLEMVCSCEQKQVTWMNLMTWLGKTLQKLVTKQKAKTWKQNYNHDRKIKNTKHDMTTPLCKRFGSLVVWSIQVCVHTMTRTKYISNDLREATIAASAAPHSNCQAQVERWKFGLVFQTQHRDIWQLLSWPWTRVIPESNVRPSVWQLWLDWHSVIYVENDSKYTSKSSGMAKKRKKIKVLQWPSENLDFISTMTWP